VPRANRISCPGFVWHITHRCHKKSFLLRFKEDRRRWRHWLFEARRRHGLCVLDYIVTSNHIHLLVLDKGGNEIPRAMQLVAGRTAQAFNRRRSRRGAFWEDRYHATAVATDHHLLQCLTYIDLNMVRAGIVSHPGNWDACGYSEIQNPPMRKRIIDRVALRRLLGLASNEDLAGILRTAAEEQLSTSVRDEAWTEAVGVGGKNFLEHLRASIGAAGRYRDIGATGNFLTLREGRGAYSAKTPPITAN
jgi:putative transposase